MRRARSPRPAWLRAAAVASTAFLAALAGIVAAAAVDDPPVPAPAGGPAATADPATFDVDAPACGRRALDAGLDPSVCPDDEPADQGEPDGGDPAARTGAALGEGEGPPDHAVACGYRALVADQHPGDVCAHHGAATPEPAGDRGPGAAHDAVGPPDHADACGWRASQAGEDPAVTCPDDEFASADGAPALPESVPELPEQVPDLPDVAPASPPGT